MYIYNRKGEMVVFDRLKIQNAIMKAMKDCITVNEKTAEIISKDIELKVSRSHLFNSVEAIEAEVYKQLIKHGFIGVAKVYEAYRAIHEYKRKRNTTDEEIMSLINSVNDEVQRENSNKKATLASTQRDLVAGIVSKDLSKRKLIPAHIVSAHDEGILHYHK